MKVRNLYLDDPDEQIVYTDSQKPTDQGIIVKGIVYVRDIIMNPPTSDMMKQGDLYIPAPTKIICEDIYMNNQYGKE